MANPQLPSAKLSLNEKFEPVLTLTLNKAPYECNRCQKSNCKLWRDYLSADELVCMKCAEGQSGKRYDPSKSYSIGWWVPALPRFEGSVDVFYNHLTTPDEAVSKWKHLPDG